jgi:hypothetical protein
MYYSRGKDSKKFINNKLQRYFFEIFSRGQRLVSTQKNSQDGGITPS